MKKEDNIEKAFREKLQDYEAPYNAAAWQAVSSALDGAAVAATAGKATLLKWVVAGVLIGATAIGGFYIANSKQEVISNHNSISPDEETTALITQSEKETDEAIDTASQEVKDSNSDAVSSVETQVDIEVLTSNGAIESIDESTQTVVEIQQDRTEDNQQISKGNQQNAEKYIAGYLLSTEICEGQTVVVSNPEVKYGNVKFQLDGRWVELSPMETYEFVPNKSMEIEFVNAEGGFLERKFIKVNSLPVADFGYEANIFEQGLPITNFESYEDATSYEWNFNGEIVRGDKKMSYSFYDKGDYEVALKVRDKNACESETSKTIHIREKYNLMAVDAFKPNDTDERNKTFMPFSLKERTVNFQLTIIDPTDNGVVFVSNDAENAWTGIDQRNGKMTAAEKAFVWKVQLFNPEKNEKSVYSGTVLHN